MAPHLEMAGLNLAVVSDEETFPEDPPWILTTPKTNFSLAQFKKETTNPLVYKQGYLELREKFPEHKHIFTDGSKSEFGVASAALMQTVPDTSLTLKLPSEASIYTAELHALLLSLKMIYQSQHKKFLIFCDSLSALQAVAGRNLNHPVLLDFHKLHTLLCFEEYDITFVWIPSHIGIRGNEKVDSLAKEAVEGQNLLSSTRVPFSDLKPLVNEYIFKEWQKEWDVQKDNKLYQIRPKLNQFLPGTIGNRRDEVVLTRLHVGHSHFTHSFYFKREDIPKCVACDEVLSVKHILLYCADLIEIRRRHYTSVSMKQLFRDVPPDVIFNFLREINIYHLI